MTRSPRSRRTDVWHGLLTALLASAASGAAALSTGQISARDDKSLFDTLLVLDEAIHLLADASSDYRKVLQEAVAGLPGNAGGEVSGGIRRFLSRTPSTGAEFPCSVAFLRLRARQALWRLRETLLGEKPSFMEPAVCYSLPFVLDVTQLQIGGTLLHIYGLDFDAASLQMVLVTSEGYQDVTAGLVRTSHYHLTLKLGDGGIPISAKSKALGLAWGHLIHHSIPVVQPTTPLCSSRVETVPGKTISYVPPSLSRDRDRRLDRAATRVWADALLDYSNNKLEATICMRAATERGGGDMVLSGCTVEFLYTTDPDRVIDGVVGNLSSHVSYSHGERLTGMNSGRPRDPVRDWAFAGLPRHSVDSRAVSVTARLNQIVVVSSEDDGCISPIAYLEAKRTTVLNPVTRRALDRQLDRVNPAILNLQPRFAPPRP